MSSIIDFIYYNYAVIFHMTVFILSVLLSLQYVFSENNANLLKKHSYVSILIVCILLIFVLGYRKAEGDSFAYAFTYRIYSNTLNVTEHGEGLWTLFTYMCKHILHLPVSGYFILIGTVYIGCTFLACWILLRENPYMAMMFCFVSLSFLAFGVNTIRNGFACSLVLLAISLWVEKKNVPLFAILCFIAFGCHKSTLWPVAAFLISVFFIRDTKIAILCWFGALVVSLVFGSFLSRYAGALGMDDRISIYLAAGESGKSEYRAGFRWDFLLYSFIPILYTWYVVVKRGVTDKKFCLIANTYIISNAVWLQFIRVAYTDRFAYLSWFLFPVVLAYASIRVPIWKDQDRKAAIILFLQTAFTAFMYYR